MFSKRKTSISKKPTVISQKIPVSLQLENFEESINPNLLQKFKEAEKTEVWDGELKYLGFFEHWLQLKKHHGKNI